MARDLLEKLDEGDRARLERAAHPSWLEPMLATLSHQHVAGPDWLFERKLDGERVLAFRDGDRLRLLSRNRNRLNNYYPELVDALGGQPCRAFVVDGEVVAFEGRRTSFARLQGRMRSADPDAARRSGIAVYYYLFDLLHLAGHDLTELPLRRRKALLRRAIDFSGPIRFTSHRNRDGEAWLREACENGWEGLIAKQADGPYRHRRSSDWRKLKCGRGQELVIGGFTEARGSRKGFGALLLGYYEDGRLRYAGKVGTGFDDELLGSLRERLDALARDRSPYAEAVREPGVTFVAPELVAEVGFTEWTSAGRLRHPRFLGLRRDKAAREVVRERAQQLPMPGRR